MNGRSVSVHGVGQCKKGMGKICTETGALKNYPYGFASGFEDERRGITPEVILGAAHCACFRMEFSFAVEKAVLVTTNVDTQDCLHLAIQGESFEIDRIAPTMQATVLGLDQAKFQIIAKAAKHDYPLSKALEIVPEYALKATRGRQRGVAQATSCRVSHDFESAAAVDLIKHNFRLKKSIDRGFVMNGFLQNIIKGESV